MNRGTLGESDGDTSASNEHNFDYSTCSTITYPRRLPRKSNAAAATTAASTFNPSSVRGAARRKMRSREVKQLKEIAKLQKTTNLLIPKSAFGRVVREITVEINPHMMRYTITALEALQEATETYLTQLLQDAYLLTMHRKCVTLSKADLLLIRALKID